MIDEIDEMFAEYSTDPYSPFASPVEYLEDGYSFPTHQWGSEECRDCGGYVPHWAKSPRCDPCRREHRATTQAAGH